MATMRWATAILIVLMGSCVSAPVVAPKHRLWILTRMAADSDTFCAEPSDMNDAWPPKCRTVGEVRDFLGAMKAN